MTVETPAHHRLVDAPVFHLEGRIRRAAGCLGIRAVEKRTPGKQGGSFEHLAS